MLIVRRAVWPLRIMLLSTLAILVVFQTLSFPGQFAHMASEEPDMAHLRWPLTAFTAVLILCAEVVLVCTWKLLTMDQQDRNFTEQALPWTDVIIGALAAAWVLVAGLFVVVGVRADDPAGPLILMAVLAGGGTFALLMLIMRALLAQATTLRTDMEGVI
jgi:hypothetical protein